MEKKNMIQSGLAYKQSYSSPVQFNDPGQIKAVAIQYSRSLYIVDVMGEIGSEYPKLLLCKSYLTQHCVISTDLHVKVVTTNSMVSTFLKPR